MSFIEEDSNILYITSFIYEIKIDMNFWNRIIQIIRPNNYPNN